MKKWLLIVFVLCLGNHLLFSQITSMATMDTICGHPTQWDQQGNLLAWYQPQNQGAAYAQVIKLASEFIKSSTPVVPDLGLKMYLLICCFQGPHIIGIEKWNRGEGGEQWMHNPACVYAGLVQGLVLDYRVYAGDPGYVGIVREMLDHQLQFGTTPANWPWPQVPYASSDPFEKVYQGATRWEHERMRGDGLHGIEPDKVGELGYAYLKFYEVTEEKRFLEAAIHCADALARHVRDVRPGVPPFAEAHLEQSPWPFRVNARTGVVISEYCSNVIEPIRLLDELIRIQSRIELPIEKVTTWQNARKIAWEWLFSINGPMKTFVWNGYFEDIPNDPARTNRVQITPLETVRYLIKHPEADPHLDIDVPTLIHWVGSVFGTDSMDAIKEQTWCYAPMGSHTARYGSLCALWYEHTGNPWYREQARRFLNFASYMTYENGVVAVGPTWLSSWFSDGYGDYIRHFTEALAAIPEWVPADQDHFLRTSSVVQQIEYHPKKIEYKLFDSESIDVLRLTSKPRKVINGIMSLKLQKQLDDPGWTWQALKKGGILRIKHQRDPVVTILK